MVFAPLYSAFLHAGIHSVSSGPPDAHRTRYLLSASYGLAHCQSQQEVVLAFNVPGTRLTRGKHRCFPEYREWQ